MLDFLHFRDEVSSCDPFLGAVATGQNQLNLVRFFIEQGKHLLGGKQVEIDRNADFIEYYYIILLAQHHFSRSLEGLMGGAAILIRWGLFAEYEIVVTILFHRNPLAEALEATDLPIGVILHEHDYESPQPASRRTYSLPDSGSRFAFAIAGVNLDETTGRFVPRASLLS